MIARNKIWPEMVAIALGAILSVVYLPYSMLILIPTFGYAFWHQAKRNSRRWG